MVGSRDRERVELKMRIAAIDIGTNTALLLVAEIDSERRVQPLLEEERIVRLGEGVDANRTLRETAITRVLNALQEYLAIARKSGVRQVIVSGTSAVRDAANRNVLLDRIREQFGLEVQILSGQREAELTYCGALSNKHELQGDILMIDIGGGSTEFVKGRGKRVLHSVSLDIGSVRLTERFIHHDPITEAEFRDLQDYIGTTLAAKLPAVSVGETQHVVGVAGTVTTLSAMHLKMDTYDPKRVDGSRLSDETVGELIESLKPKTLAQRSALAGLRPERADVILSGALILSVGMKYLGAKEVIVSDRGVRYGLILDSFESIF